MQMNIAMLVISMLLFFIMFFGIGFILNMLLRMSWITALVYPIISILIIDDVKFYEYFTNSQESFIRLFHHIIRLAIADITILLCGLFGAICAGFTIKSLRKRGYQMF